MRRFIVCLAAVLAALLVVWAACSLPPGPARETARKAVWPFD